jgi:enoyl-CoA hydratase/carnithine racemase
VGGGVGLSVHGSIRVATETTLFAMPELGIGFFPDVGGTHFLPRLKGGIGMWLALTGARLKGYSSLQAGVATHFIARERLELALAALSDLCASKLPITVQSVADCLKLHDCGDMVVEDERALIDAMGWLFDPARHGASSSAAEMLERILPVLDARAAGEAIPADMEQFPGQMEAALTPKLAATYAKSIRGASPLSLAVTYRAMKHSASSLAANLAIEYGISQHFMQGDDFFEGVRALLVEKDNKPAWNPASLASVPESVVDQYFEPLAPNKQLVCLIINHSDAA